ncbi:serine--tRNA ligase [Tanacetum coccineum]
MFYDHHQEAAGSVPESHPGGPKISEFDWGTGETPRSEKKDKEPEETLEKEKAEGKDVEIHEAEKTDDNQKDEAPKKIIVKDTEKQEAKSVNVDKNVQGLTISFNNYVWLITDIHMDNMSGKVVQCDTYPKVFGKITSRFWSVLRCPVWKSRHVLIVFVYKGCSAIGLCASVVYSIEGSDQCLIRTVEIPVGGIHMDSILANSSLPIKYAAFSHCFCTEADAAGVATRRLSALRENFNAKKLGFLKFDIPIMALTATATTRVRGDILKTLDRELSSSCQEEFGTLAV